MHTSMHLYYVHTHTRRDVCVARPPSERTGRHTCIGLRHYVPYVSTLSFPMEEGASTCLCTTYGCAASTNEVDRHVTTSATLGRHAPVAQTLNGTHTGRRLLW